MKNRVVLVRRLAPLVAAIGLVAGLLPFSAGLVAGVNTVVTVTPGSPNGWIFFQETAATQGNLVPGPQSLPMTAPIGNGSARLSVDSTGGILLGTGAMDGVPLPGTPLNQINRLEYGAFRTSGAANLAISLQLGVDFDPMDAFAGFQGRLVFEPSLIPASPMTGVWQNWNALGGRWWATQPPFNAQCSQASPCPWGQVLTNWPSVRFHPNPALGGLAFKAGGGWVGGFDGAVDALIAGIGPNQTTVNFEPAPIQVMPGTVIGQEGVAIPAGTVLGTFIDPYPHTYGGGQVCWVAPAADCAPTVQIESPPASGIIEVRTTVPKVYADDDVAVAHITVQAFDGAVEHPGVEFDAGVTILNGPPDVTSGPDQMAPQFVVTTFDLGSFSDLGPDSPWTVTVNWGDGSGLTTFDVPAPGSLEADHVYGDDGLFNVTFEVKDNDGGVDGGAFDVGVGANPPNVDAGPDREADEGETILFSDFEFTAPVLSGPFTVTIDWGDGTLPTLIINVPDDGPIPPQTHTYADDGPYTVNVGVENLDGAEGNDDIGVIVANVPPTVQPPDVTTTGGTTTAKSPFTDPGVNDTHTGTVDWGDGAGPQPANPDPPFAGGAGGFSGTHNYTKPGVYFVTIKVTDDDDGMDSDTTVIEISAQDAKRGIIKELEGLLPTGNKDADKKIGDAIKSIKDSLNPAFWSGPSTPHPKKGDNVFNEERKAVAKLNDVKNPSPELDDILDGLIDDLVNIDRLFATNAIGGAPDGKQKDKAQDEIDKGDRARDAGAPEKAIDHYRNAWRHIKQ